MTYQYFSVADANYAYKVQGEGEPLLLLHGFTGSSDTWKLSAKELSEQFQVITIDLPGHGKTTCQTPRTMETFSADLAKILNFLQVDKINILGYSMGGRTALSFAMYYPEMIQTIILESASPGLKTEAERGVRYEQDKKLSEMIQTNGISDFVSYWENIPLFETQKKLPLEVQAQVRAERLSQTESGLVESLLYMGTGKQRSWWSKLDNLQQPVLLMVGEEDEKFVQINREMESFFPNSELHIVDNAGHAIHVEQCEKFVTIVMEFIRLHNSKEQ